MNKEEPIFKSVFGFAWNALSPVFQKRYINRPFTDDKITVEGQMEIWYSNLLVLLMPFFKIFHLLVPYKGSQIPVKVDFQSSAQSDAICLYRTFYFPDKKPYTFNSCMHVIKENEVIERMALGFAWKTHYFYDGSKVVMEHTAYVWRICGIDIPVPLEIFIGRGHAEEVVIDENSYRVSMNITHAWFGTLYRYQGDFTFVRMPV